MALAVEQDELPDPAHVCLLGAGAVVADAQRRADLIEQARLEGRDVGEDVWDVPALGRHDGLLSAEARTGTIMLVPGWQVVKPLV